jgi:hypothetical protein
MSVPPAVSKDTVPPIVTIVDGPSNGSRLASPVVNLTGTASDNAGIDHVEVQVNEGAYQVCNGTSAWNVQAQLTLVTISSVCAVLMLQTMFLLK